MRASSIGILMNSPALETVTAIKSSEVIDLTSKMDTAGMLTWEAPQGNWAIIRFGYTTNAAQNGPATKAGTGLECDKMDTSALNLHFNNFPMQAIKAAGQFKGNTFDYLFVDSWECNYQNWTRKFPEEFQKRRGYGILQYIPAICGMVVESPQKTENFFSTFRKLFQTSFRKIIMLIIQRSAGSKELTFMQKPFMVAPPIPLSMCSNATRMPVIPCLNFGPELTQRTGWLKMSQLKKLTATFRHIL